MGRGCAMRLVLLLLAVLVSLGSAGQDQQASPGNWSTPSRAQEPARADGPDPAGSVVVDYDRFNDIESVRLEPMRIGDILVAAVAPSYIHDTPDDAAIYYLVTFVFVPMSGNFEICHGVAALADGRRVPFTEPEYSVASSGIATIKAQTSRDGLSALAQAAEPELALCRVEMRLSDSQRRTLREFHETLVARRPLPPR